MEIRFYAADFAEDAALRFAVIAARYKGRWIFCKNKKRGWEIPGGHREAGETILEAAKRELFEETGAVKFSLTPVAAYSITDFGMLYFAEVETLGDLPSFEIERIDFFTDPPDGLSFPVYPAHLARVQEFLKENHL